MTSPPRRIFSSNLSNSQDDWKADEDFDTDDDDEDDDAFGLGGEDEFGLPSIITASKKSRRIASHKVDDPGGTSATHKDGKPALGPGILASRRQSNSADIAEERGAPSYPVAKKSDGKILRPQYKEILKGMGSCSNEM